MTLILIGLGSGGCSLSRPDAYARMNATDFTGSLSKQPATPPVPTESDLAFARTAASDVLTKGDKDSSQPWENPETGARGSVTPLSQAYSAEDGRTCRTSTAARRAGCRALPARPAMADGKFTPSNPGRGAKPALPAVAKMQLTTQMKPKRANCPKLREPNSREGDVTDARPL
ncbi:RT0821/Lpp0805 family surface protein [Bradyrhizobium valentinum]|uniref:RT0821/Lpp0805 family surface protein n=1 Tax=Bradyrhizobium valentinum TaxID=1518501 RepID=UPI0030B80EDE